VKTKRPKIEIGTTFPYWHEDRYVNAEVVNCIKIGSRMGIRKRNWWTVRLTESQQPIVRKGGPLAGTFVEFETDTKTLADRIEYVESLPHYSPARAGTVVVQWIDTEDARGLWCEIRDQHKCGGSRNTHWQRCEYGTVDALLASGDAVACNS
jgi:hypothetical protein